MAQLAGGVGAPFIGGVVVDSGTFNWSNGRYAVIAEPSPAYHGLQFHETFGTYGYLMKPLGLVLATAAMVFLAALGGHEFRWKEVTLLAVALVVFSVLVFVKGLTLPFPLWPDRFS